MIPAIYASAMMRRGGGIACGLETEYGGGNAFPSEFRVTLGTGLGAVFLEYATGARPDKIEVWVSGAKVLDTGYVGDVSYQTDLDSALADLGLPSEPIRQRAGAGTTTDDFSDVKTREYAAYYKSTTSAQATVRVYAPLSGTSWRLKLNCPDGYYYQIFDESGTFAVPSHVTAVDALLVAGGGGGGYGVDSPTQPQGGGGAGGLITGSVAVTPESSVSVEVGFGGAGGIGPSSTPASNGSNSSFLSLSAVGGGRGGGPTSVLPGDGGSGGGGSTTTPGGAGTPGQGNNGGQGTISTAPYSTGSGGGSKTAGGNGTAIPGSGAGGDGHTLGELGWGGAIAFGAPKAVAGGGGGGNRASSGSRPANPGGFGGGGDSGLAGGTDAQKSGQSGINGTGSGGGGPTNLGVAPAASGGDGGSGLVIIRYPAIPGL